jgi:molecular chaperone GrpE
MHDEPKDNLDESTMTEASALDFEQLQKALEEAKALAESHWDKLLRKEAEFQNFRARSEKDVANARKFSIERFAEELLAVVDSFEQALQIGAGEHNNAASIMEGLKLTHQVLIHVLDKFGVKAIDPAKELFNPQFHEAILMQETEEVAPNHVLTVVQKGFLVHERVLRPARVIVAKAPA